VLCAALYVEESVHFIRYGSVGDNSDSHVTDIKNCQKVKGTERDYLCPIPGYGMAHYRYGEHKDPKFPSPNHIFFVD
jgi:hypothetical protein